MKARTFLLCLALLPVLLNCHTQEPATPKSFDNLSGFEDVTLGAEDTQVAILTFTASDDWHTVIDNGWLSANPASGKAGDARVIVTSQKNVTTEPRTGSVRFECSRSTVGISVTQEGLEPEPEPEPVPGGPYLTDPFSSELHFSTSRLRTTTAVMQSFDLAKDGKTLYYTQLNNKFRVYLSWNEKNSQATPTARCMTLCYTGHGSNFSLEESGDGKFPWMDNYSSKNASGDYWNAQIVSRFPIVAGKTVKAWEAEENSYFGEKNISVAVDFEGDMLTILGISSGRIRTYRLSDLKALPIEYITIESVTYGGEEKADDAETTYTPVVKARDARKLAPLGDFTISRGAYEDGTQISWQGFDIHDGLIYQAQGNGYTGTPSKGWVQVRRINGSVVLPLTPFKALEDLDALRAAGITDTGYMEPEGVKYRDGYLYCGFASKSADNVRRGTILRYDPKLVK